MAQTIDLKRGDTLSLAGFAKLPEGTWAATAQVDRASGAALDDLTVELVPLEEPGPEGQTHALSLYKDADGTLEWPTEILRCDIRFTDDSGVVVHSPTFAINVVYEVTNG